ncbi:class I SAM-dependent methyltransferase [Chitinophaga nivalis]|uniref:Class I SAM-dependent methyltransferase n=1 Tax=Chitinophaga nivalis TaxID=2991709 RepID=A0ABT3IJE9_9BACT|nr:class I SAM-dependent methyltransferase [Chitinophaga nivalis]MCW3466218.1 class I SAM-dependent methyltransferase [Chitinophaga nivalis]MCW3484091.1 class I SAM-dependent methyltransferase [Chitinophaga nivalis]
MEFHEAIELIRHPTLTRPQESIWADLGCGSGLFTYALAHQLAAGSTVYAIDKSPVRLHPHPLPRPVTIFPQQTDFVQSPLQLPLLQGILMANALHYVADKRKLLRHLRTYLQPDGCLLIVEYDTTAANQWVPYPIPPTALKALLADIGFAHFLMLGTRPSVYQPVQLYAALITS